MDPVALVAVAIGIGAAILFTRLASIERRLNRLSRIDAKLDAVLKNAGIAFDELHDLPPDVREALERGETIEAIKRFRQATGLGLKEAKDAIDEARRRRVSPSS
jgi:ribosomal protein L7/L12